MTSIQKNRNVFLGQEHSFFRGVNFESVHVDESPIWPEIVSSFLERAEYSNGVPIRVIQSPDTGHTRLF